MPLLLPRRYEGTKVRRYEGTFVQRRYAMQCKEGRLWHLMTIWIKDDQFGNFLLERHFDREKDSEKYLKISFFNRSLWKSRLRRKVDRECLIPYLRWPINRDGNLNRGYINAKFSYVIKAAAMILFIMVLSSIWISLSSPRSRPSCHPRSNPYRFQRREPKRAVW